MREHTVRLVLDTVAGTKLGSISERGPTWAIHSSVNRAACEDLWQAAKNKGISLDLTIFTHPANVTSVQEWESLLDHLEMHFGEYAQDPPMDSIEVLGAGISLEARTALSRCGFDVVLETPDGFVAEQRARIPGEAAGE